MFRFKSIRSRKGTSQVRDENALRIIKPDKLAKALQAYDRTSDFADTNWLDDELKSLFEKFVLIAERSGLREEAEDVAQQALIKLIEKRDEISYGSTNAFARNIINGEIMNAIRRGNTSTAKFFQLDEPKLDRIDPTQERREILIEEYRSEVAKCRDAALQKLSRRERSFLLIYQYQVEQRGVGYLARFFGMSEDKVKKKASRLRRKVQELAEPCLSRINYPK